MKRIYIYFFILLLISFSFLGCSVKIGNYIINDFTITKSKPNNYYYTNNMLKKLTLGFSVKINVLDTNFYKEKELSKDDIDIVKSFGKSLKTSYFIDKPEELPEKPAYKLFITINNDKYVINVYDERYLSVYPWDGTYPMDYIDMKEIQAHYNLFGLCKYLIEQ